MDEWQARVSSRLIELIHSLIVGCFVVRRAWYERLVLILSKHCGRDEDKLKEAREIAIEALEDPYTHISKSYSPEIRRRS